MNTTATIPDISNRFFQPELEAANRDVITTRTIYNTACSSSTNCADSFGYPINLDLILDRLDIAQYGPVVARVDEYEALPLTDKDLQNGRMPNAILIANSKMVNGSK